MVAVSIAKEHTPAELRALARRERDGRVAARVIALTNALDGMSREAAARAAGMDRQTLRDWVHRFNAEGVEGLRDQPRPGRPPRMTEGQQAAFEALVLRGPDPERDGVSAWRLADVCAHAGRAYGVRYSEWGMARLLRRLGLPRQKARPRHPQGSAAERAAFKKGAWVEARGARQGAPGQAAAALVRG